MATPRKMPVKTTNPPNTGGTPTRRTAITPRVTGVPGKVTVTPVPKAGTIRPIARRAVERPAVAKALPPPRPMGTGDRPISKPKPRATTPANPRYGGRRAL